MLLGTKVRDFGRVGKKTPKNRKRKKERTNIIIFFKELVSLFYVRI